MRIDIANQHAEKIEYKEGDEVIAELVIYSPDKKQIQNLKEMFSCEGMSNSVQKQFLEDETEINYIYFEKTTGKVEAFRSITSHYELYYYEDSEEKLIITDHMNNMLSRIPVEERKVSLDGVCDVVLYQHSYGKETYLQGVYRLQCGEKLVWEDNELSVSLVQKLIFGRYDMKGADGAAVLENSLKEAAEHMTDKDSVNALSGGVDSTLVQAIMGNPKAVCAAYDYPGFQCEKEYAMNAAELLHSDLTVYDIPMKDFMEELLEVTKAYGMPAYNMTGQIIQYTLAKNVKEDHMVLGELAGAVYGLELREPYDAEWAKKIDMKQARNYGNMNSSIAAKDDIPYIERLFGKERVERRLLERNNYVLDRMDQFDPEDSSEANYLQFGHMLYYYSNTGINIEEQTEMAYGKTVSTLFCSRKLLEEYLSLPLEGRYESKELGEKPYAKQLLHKYAPEYGVNKKKLGGSLPRTWMVTEGPMAGYFKNHELPSFIDASIRDWFLSPTWETSWCVKYMIMYSLWEENVLRKEVTPLPSKWLIQ